MPRVAVVVLGDVGHSPRMMYHCASLIDRDIDVDVIGYLGSAPYERLLESSRVAFRYLRQPPSCIPSVFGLFVKLIWQFLTLFYMLAFRVSRPDVILLQNPPGLPTLLVCWMVAKIRRCFFVVDWHNYTFSIFSLRYKRNFFVRLVEWFEFTFGRRADLGFCVSNAMKEDLARRGVGRIITHYDRASSIFQPLNDSDKRTVIQQLSNELGISSDFDFSTTAVLISSTSWTADEDFHVLLTALKTYDDADHLPCLLVIITGKGPLKNFYLKIVAQMNFRKVAICTPWLKAEDYPKLLACADVGVSLHSSSSGLDLPMKVVDMQGCRLPVLALRFPCIDELVKEGVNGFTFKDSHSLAQLLETLFSDFPRNDKLKNVKLSCMHGVRGTWDDEWNAKVWPSLKKLL